MNFFEFYNHINTENLYKEAVKNINETFNLLFEVKSSLNLYHLKIADDIDQTVNQILGTNDIGYGNLIRSTGGRYPDGVLTNLLTKLWRQISSNYKAENETIGLKNRLEQIRDNPNLSTEQIKNQLERQMNTIIRLRLPAIIGDESKSGMKQAPKGIKPSSLDFVSSNRSDDYDPDFNRDPNGTNPDDDDSEEPEFSGGITGDEEAEKRQIEKETKIKSDLKKRETFSHEEIHNVLDSFKYERKVTILDKALNVKNAEWKLMTVSSRDLRFDPPPQKLESDTPEQYKEKLVNYELFEHPHPDLKVGAELYHITKHIDQKTGQEKGYIHQAVIKKIEEPELESSQKSGKFAVTSKTNLIKIAKIYYEKLNNFENLIQDIANEVNGVVVRYTYNDSKKTGAKQNHASLAINLTSVNNLNKCIELFKEIGLKPSEPKDITPVQSKEFDFEPDKKINKKDYNPNIREFIIYPSNGLTKIAEMTAKECQYDESIGFIGQEIRKGEIIDRYSEKALNNFINQTIPHAVRLFNNAMKEYLIHQGIHVPNFTIRNTVKVKKLTGM